MSKLPVALIIEDEAFWSGVMARLLRQIGVDSQVACDAVRARELLRARFFDVVLVDLVLPGQEGIDLIQEIQRDRLLLNRCVIVTAHEHIASYFSAEIPIIDKNRIQELVPQVLRILGEREDLPRPGDLTAS
jgi:DNA-binding NtrC family response regulator